MTSPTPPERPAAALSVDPVEVTPGFPARVPVRVTNQLYVPATFVLEVVGMDPEWVGTPGPVGPLRPGEQVVTEVSVLVPVGHPAAQLRCSLLARLVSTGPGGADDGGRRGGTADLTVVVGDGSVIGAVLEPPEVRGGWRGRFDLVLFNRSRAPLRVDVHAASPDPTVHVRFERVSEVLDPGREVRVRGRIEARRPVVGSPQRRPFAVRVQGRTTPVALEGTFHQRAVIGRSVTRVTAIVAVIALWAAVAAVGISSLNTHLHRAAVSHANAANPPPPAPAQPTGGSGTNAGSNGASGGGSASGGGGSGSASGGGSGSSSGGGSGSSSGGGSGSSSGGGSGSSSGGGSGSSSGGGSGSAPSGGSSSPAGAGVTGGTTRVSGKVTAPQPGGVTVSIAPTSLVDEAAQGASASAIPASIQTAAYVVHSSAGKSQPASAASPIGKVYGAFSTPTTFADLTAATDPTITTTTTPDGAWAFAGIRAPGYYLVTFSKPGYQTQRYIATVGADGSAVNISATINPGGGSLSGTVFSPAGPLGDVTLTITDGTTTVQASTPTVGAVGHWSVSGLTTPDTYLVTATETGYSTETTLVTLGASGTATGVNLTMKPGEGSLTGTVSSARTAAGVGGVTVTASNGATSRTTTTTTTTPVGSYTLPNLPIPGTYAVTVSGDGWVSQTQQINLTGNSVVNASLTPSGADVNGIVSGTNGTGLSGAGLVLSNDTNTFKTLTQSAVPVGGFDFGQIPPGQYVLTATDFGFATQSAEVNVGPGQTQRVNLKLPFVGQANQNTASIQGAVQDLFNAQPLGPPGHIVSLALDHQPTGATTNAQGNYVIAHVGPGVHTVTASAAGFESASASVSVPLGAVAFAPVIGLPKLDTVAGQVRSNAGGFVPDPCAPLTDPNNTSVVLFQSAACTTKPPVPDPTLPGIPPSAQGGFEIDNVPHGNYNLILSSSSQSGCNTGAGFVSNIANPIAVSLALDTDLVLTGAQSPALNLGPVFNVVTLEATAGGGVPSQIGGVTVTATDQITGQQSTCTSPAPPGAGSPPTVTVVPNLNSGHPYVATFKAPDGAVAPPIAFIAQFNNSTTNTALLYIAPKVGMVTLQFNYNQSGSTQVCPEIVQNPPPPPPNCPSPPDLSQVQLTGTIGFSFPSPGQPGAPIQQTFTATANGNGTWSFSSSDISQLLPSASMTFTVTDPIGAFQPFFTTISPTASGTIGDQLFTLTAAPVTITNNMPVGTISPTSGVTATVTPAIQGASIVDNAGVLQWSTTSSSVPVQPGVYTLAFTAPQFDSQTALYQVPFFPGSAFPVVGPITLVAHVTLTVTPSFTAQTGLALPTVFLFKTTTGTPVLVGQHTLSGAGDSGAFSNLSVKDTFRVIVRGPGFATSTTDPPPFTGDTTITPTLSPEGFITGTLSGQINNTTSPLAGITVTATLVTPPPPPATCPSDTDSPPSVTTDSGGNFTIIGDPATNDGGLCSGAKYKLSASVPGYSDATATVTISTTAANPAPTFVAVGQQIQQTVVVQDQDKNPVDGVTITDFSPIGSAVGVTAKGNGVYVLTIDPTSYTFIFSKQGYTTQSQGPIAYSPNQKPPNLPVTLTLDKNTITGTVTTPGPGGTPADLTGVTVSLLPDQAGASPLVSTKTDANGVYTFTDEGTTLGYIPDGTYILSASFKGYTYLQQPQAFQTTLPSTIVNLSLAPNLVNVSVAVTSTLGSASDLTGATMTLTPAGTSTGTITCGASQLVAGLGVTQSVMVQSGSAPFKQLVPDVYTLTGSDTDHPTQAGTTLTVCPDGSTAPSPAAFRFQEGEVAGSVTVPSGFSLVASSVAVNVTGGTAFPPSPVVSCPPPPATDCTTGTFSSIVALGSSYTVQGTLTGLTTATKTTPVLTATSPSDTTIALNLTAAPREVDVTVQSGGTTPINLSAGTVTLLQRSGSTPCVGSGTTYKGTVVNGVAQITGVAPNPNDYDVAIADGPITACDSVPVPIGTGSVATTANVPFGQITGTVALNPAPAKATTVTAKVCDTAAGCKTPILVQTIPVDTSGSATYTLQLPPSSAAGDVVTFSAPKYTAQSTSALTFNDGDTITAPTVTLGP